MAPASRLAQYQWRKFVFQGIMLYAVRYSLKTSKSPPHLRTQGALFLAKKTGMFTVSQGRGRLGEKKGV
ncbi:hypothetical protein J6590_005691 [Homalodisca vitripennis]|nr:hypothetical protein J6590_005691 [Homalodisca vitripennis]